MASPEGGSRAAPPPSRAKLLAAYAAVYVIWGSTYLAIRFGLGTLPPLLMAGARFTIGGLALFVWALVRGENRPTRNQWWAAAVVGALLLLFGNGGVTWAEQQRMPSGIAALLITTEPLWVVLLAWARPGGVRPARQAWVGLALGLVGVGVLIGPDALGSGAGSGVRVLPAIVVVGAALAWAAGSVWPGRDGLPKSAPLATGMQMLVGGVLLLAVSAGAGEWRHFDPSRVSATSLAALGYLILFGSLIAFSAYVWLLTVEPPSRASTYAFVNPVVAVLLGWAVAGEPMGGRVLVAAALTVGAVVLITRAPTHQPAAALKATTKSAERDRLAA